MVLVQYCGGHVVLWSGTVAVAVVVVVYKWS